MTGIDYRTKLTNSPSNKALTWGFRRNVGRNNFGRITTRHKGAGHKRLFREIDFKYDKKNIPARIDSVEYDPNRSAFISLAVYKDGEKRYVVVPQGIKQGDQFIISEKADIKPANRLMLKNIPVGTFIYNVELKPDGGAKIARSAGDFAEVVANDGKYTHLKMPSTEIRRIIGNSWASIGSVSNEDNRLINIGKAGRSRWLGIRPTVRGSAQNAVDHPYGGGEGRQGRGTRRAKTRWGKPVGKGQKSRRAKKYSNKLIISRRRLKK